MDQVIGPTIERADTDGSLRPPDRWQEFWRHEQGATWLGRILFVLRERFWVRAFVRVALEHSAPGRVLEAGCGSALSSILLCKIRGDRVTGLDLSDEALALAKAAAQRHGVEIALVRGDLRHLPYPDQAFDVAWSSGTLEHFDDPVPIVREMRRVSRQVIAILPKPGWVFWLLERVTRLLGEKYRSAIIEGNEHWYSREELAAIFREAGCAAPLIREIRCVGVFPYWVVVQ